jgi:arylsulfatase A-like enzyme
MASLSQTVSLLLLVAASTAMGADRPNIILILSDDHSAHEVGINGGAVSTPHLDALARQGANFSAAFTTNPIGQPARAALLTGMDPWRVGICVR